MINFRELARLAVDEFGVELSPAQVRAMETYATKLIEWNEKINLTAITHPLEMEVKHFLDSLTPLLAIGDMEQGNLIDVGTGAGFPGLVLKIARPQLPVTLVEATGKKAEFCRHVIEQLGLKQIHILDQRAELAGQSPQHRGAYRWAVARAVARLDVLAEYLLPFVRVGGLALAQKGETAIAEVQQAEPAIERLGGRLAEIRPIDLPRVPDTRYLVVIEKVAGTPEHYPRRPGIPAKRPLAN